MKKRELLNTVGGYVNWCNPVENSVEVLLKTKNRVTI